MLTGNCGKVAKHNFASSDREIDYGNENVVVYGNKGATSCEQNVNQMNSELMSFSGNSP